ncbi:MAG: acetyl-CoA carboxylase, carboxyltransferase subunit beta [Planctomycetota bacterium]
MPDSSPQGQGAGRDPAARPSAGAETPAALGATPEMPGAAPADAGPVRRNVEVPEGLWIRCVQCGAMIYRRILEEGLHVCPECDHHYRVDARTRIGQLNDPGTFEEFLPRLESTDPLEFRDRMTYRERLEKTKQQTNETEAIIVGKGFIKGRPLIMGVMNPDFIMGSMGAVVGEKVAAAAERAVAENLPLLMVTCSGGARMMEGMVSLVQMAKTAAAIAKLDSAGGLYIVLMTDPTTAGVAASFAFLGDVTLAEPGALIGFAGPRVIANTIKATLPEGFQRAEFMLEHGFIDRIVHRRDLRSEIARIIDYCNK